MPCEVDPAERAERLIVGIVKHMTEEVEFLSGARRRILISHGDGDGGLFTGILVRYLGMAASSPLLSDEARALASTLVYSTARALWEGRREFDPDLPMNEYGIDPNEIRGKALVQFSPRFTEPMSKVVKPARRWSCPLRCRRGLFLRRRRVWRMRGTLPPTASKARLLYSQP